MESKIQSIFEELYSDVTQRHSRSDSVPSRSNSASDRTHFGGVSRSHSVGDPSNHGIRIETHSPSPTHVSHLRKPKEHGHGTKEHSPQLSPRGGSPESPVDRKPSPQLSPRPKHALRQSPVDPDSASPRLRANPGPAQTQEKIDQLNKQKEALMAEKTRIEKEKKKRAKEEKERQEKLAFLLQQEVVTADGAIGVGPERRVTKGRKEKLERSKKAVVSSPPSDREYCLPGCSVFHEAEAPCLLCNCPWSQHSGHYCHAAQTTGRFKFG